MIQAFNRKNICGIIITLLLLSLFPGKAIAKDKNKKKVKGQTEQGLVYHILSCLQHKDAYCYMDLFPDMDTFSKLVMQYSDPNSKEYREMAALQDDPVRMMHADSVFRAALKETFDSVIAQGEEMGIHWQSIIPLRYELQKARQTRNVLYEKIAPVRFMGYIFFFDGQTRMPFGFIVGDMLQIKGEWYGGRIRQVYEGSTRDEIEDSRMEWRRKKLEARAHPDSVKKENSENQEVPETNPEGPQKMIVERKFYAGMFDNEIPVQLYIRYLKSCPDKVCAWEAIYRFGDQDDFIRLTVSKTEDGKWQFTEIPPSGSMELSLENSKYTGSWISADTQTGYDVLLTELPASAKKIKNLDAIFLDLKTAKGIK